VFGAAACGIVCLAALVAAGIYVYDAWEDSRPPAPPARASAAPANPDAAPEAPPAPHGASRSANAPAEPPAARPPADRGPSSLSRVQRARWQRLRRLAGRDGGYCAVVRTPERGWHVQGSPAAMAQVLAGCTRQDALAEAEERCRSSGQPTAVVDLFGGDEPRVVCWYFVSPETDLVCRNDKMPAGEMGAGLRAYLRRLPGELTAEDVEADDERSPP
jgi:hypothetical protein